LIRITSLSAHLSFKYDPDRDHGQIASSMLNGIDVFHGDCTDSEILQEINVKKCDCFIAAGNDAEDNIMSCLLAKTSGAQMVIAVRNDDRYIKLFSSLGIDYIINPNDITLNMIIEKIQMIPIGSYLKLKCADSEVMRIKVKKESSIVGTMIRDLDDFHKKSIVIGCIIRGDDVIIPWGGTQIQEEDEILLLTSSEHIDWVNKHFNTKFSFFK